MQNDLASRRDRPPRQDLDGRETDVAVIGGGVIGTCAAYFLTRAGRKVALLEQAELGSGCSSGNAGLVGPRYSLPLAAPGIPAMALRWMFDPQSPLYIRPRLEPALLPWFWRFWRASQPARLRQAIPILRDMHRLTLALLREIDAAEPLACDLVRQGQLMIYRTARGFADGQDDARLLQEHGIPFRMLDSDQLREILPPAAADLAGAIHYTDDAHLDPARFLEQLARLASAAGAEVHEGAEVIGFERHGRRITALATRRGRLRVGQVVLAAGAWSAGLARRLDLRVPLQPAKGYSITMPSPPDFPNLGMLLAEAKVAVTRMGARLRFAGTLELAGMDLSINDRRVAAIRRAVRRYLPQLSPPPSIEVWRGLRPLSPDTLPYIGRPRAYDNIVVATGHSMIGLSLGPATGMLVTQILQDQPPAIDLRLLRADRHG